MTYKFIDKNTLTSLLFIDRRDVTKFVLENYGLQILEKEDGMKDLKNFLDGRIDYFQIDSNKKIVGIEYTSFKEMELWYRKEEDNELD